MIKASDFVYEVKDLAQTITGYQTSKSGQAGLCDCIGLIMGAMSQLGHGSYPMHSTNYFARYQMQFLREMDAGELREGHIVYKATDSTADLNDRYKQGGRYYTGDLLDYYHVGVVTSVNPLEITHCTQNGSVSGIKRDYAADGWTHYGSMLGVVYNNSTPVKGEHMSKTAYVHASNGKPVRLRKAPGTDAETITKVQPGTVVTITEQSSDGWAQIVTPDDRVGYMMAQFLKVLEYADDTDDGQHSDPDGADDILQRLSRIEAKLDAVLGGAG